MTNKKGSPSQENQSSQRNLKISDGCIASIEYTTYLLQTCIGHHFFIPNKNRQLRGIV
jgi:hypothetical protein